MSWLWNGKTDGRVDVIARTKQTRTKDVRHQYRASRRHCWMLCYGIFAAIAKRGNKNSNLYIKVTPQKRMQIIRATLASSPTRPLFGQQFYMSHNFTISGTFHLQPFMLDVPSPFRRPVCHPDPYSWVLVAASATLSFFGIHLTIHFVDVWLRANCMHDDVVGRTVQLSTLNDIREGERGSCDKFRFLHAFTLSTGNRECAPRVCVQVGPTTWNGCVDTSTPYLHSIWLARA